MKAKIAEWDVASNKYGDEATYGEVLFDSFVAILERLDPQPGQVFWDLGCGDAKPSILAAMFYPQLAACKGVEYMPELAASAKTAARLA